MDHVGSRRAPGGLTSNDARTAVARHAPEGEPLAPLRLPSRAPAWRRLLRRLLELGLALALYRVYAALRNAQGQGQPAERPTVRARHHGFDVLSLERTLHVDIEHTAQSVVLAAPEWVVRAANVYYSTVHLTLTALVFLWLLLRRPLRHTMWRTVLLLGTGIALLGFALFPTMPPRLLPGVGYVDTVVAYGGLWSSQAPVLEHVAHPYAAMPSLHVVWALWVGAALWREGRWPWRRWLGPLHVAATAVAVVVTGNHWLLDVVAGAAVFAVAAVGPLRRPRRPIRPAPVRVVLVDAA